MNKNLFMDASYDDKNSKLKDKKKNKDTEDNNKKDDNVVCRCFIF